MASPPNSREPGFPSKFELYYLISFRTTLQGLVPAISTGAPKIEILKNRKEVFFQ